MWVGMNIYGHGSTLQTVWKGTREKRTVIASEEVTCREGILNSCIYYLALKTNKMENGLLDRAKVEARKSVRSLL